MKSLKSPTGQIVRWLQFLEPCSLKVTHCPAYEHKIAVLSRNPCKPGMKQEEKNPQTKECILLKMPIIQGNHLTLFGPKTTSAAVRSWYALFFKN